MKKTFLLMLIGVFSLGLLSPASATSGNVSSTETDSSAKKVKVEAKYKRYPVELKGTLISVASTTAPTSIVMKIDKISPKKWKKWIGFYPETGTELKIAITEKTKITRKYWGQSSLEELTAGDLLQVSAWTNEDSTVTAVWVKDDSLHYTLKVKKGTIESIDAVNKTFVLKNEKTSLTVKINDTTKFYSAGMQAITFADLKVGDKLHVRGIINTKTKILDASLVRVMPVPVVATSTSTTATTTN